MDFDTGGDGLALGMWDSGQAPMLTSKEYLFFGKVSVEMRAAEGQGLITAFVLMSDSGDEIDWVRFSLSLSFTQIYHPFQKPPQTWVESLHTDGLVDR